MIANIKDTVQSAMTWPTFNYGSLSLALSGPFNDDYNQWNQVYQCHGDPNGKVYVNVHWFAICFDVDNQIMYIKNLFFQLFPQTRRTNTGWITLAP